MALYSFSCDNCNHQREVKLSFSEHEKLKNSIVCECGTTLKQIVDVPLFKLNGGGWYREGYNTTTSKKELDKELKIYDNTRNKNEQGKFEREI